MQTYKLYIDVLYTVSSSGEHDIEIEAFGQQQFELVGNQLNMSNCITLQAETALEAINKATAMVNAEYATNHLGYYAGVDGEGKYGYLNVQYETCHISFEEEVDEELENVLEDLNAEYYKLTA